MGRQGCWGDRGDGCDGGNRGDHSECESLFKGERKEVLTGLTGVMG